MSLTRIFLRALKHPDADAFDVTGPGQLQSLVLWLENTKIRHYPPNERAQLQSPDQAEWRAALERYLDDVACPLPKASRSETSLVDWLLSYAVDLEYGDKKEQYNATISHSVKESVAPEDWIPPRLPPFPDLQSQEAQDALRSVLSALRMEPESIDVSAADVACAKSVLESQILPTLAEAARLPGSAPTSASALSRFPLGFSTGDESVDVAATVLRLLYIKDLRSLQTQIDEAIVEQQEMTAHPRTDAAAGRVGR